MINELLFFYSHIDMREASWSMSVRFIDIEVSRWAIGFQEVNIVRTPAVLLDHSQFCVVYSHRHVYGEIASNINLPT